MHFFILGYTDLEGSPELVIKGGSKRKEGKKSTSGAISSRGGRRPNHAGYGELEEDEDVIFELWWGARINWDRQAKSV